MYLVIDTATSQGIALLGKEGHVLAFAPLGLTRNLEATFDALLKECNAGPKDLNFIAVGIGPGSYTGIRVAASSAKAISYALNIPLVTLSSLEGLLPPSNYEGEFLSVIDARVGGVYTRLGKRGEGSEDQLLSLDDFIALLKRVPCIVTPDFAPLKARIKEQFVYKVFETGPSSSHLARRAWEKFCQKEYTSDTNLPLQYLRLTQAEMEKLPNKGQLE